MNGQGKLLSGAVMGAGLMYLLDPERGARRRGLVRNQVAHATHRLGDGLDATAHDVRNRAKGTAAEVKARLHRGTVDDAVLDERVRSAIGRAASHPRAITTTLSQGRVTLEGHVLEDELDTVLHTVKRVRGVSEVINQLEVHRDPGGVPSLQGGRPREPRAELRQEHWAPATRLLMGSFGGLIAWYGIRARGPLGMGAGMAAAGILARALANRP
jgi:BON domain-containing protein